MRIALSLLLLTLSSCGAGAGKPAAPEPVAAPTPAASVPAAAPAARAPTVVKRVVVSQARKSGESVTTIAPDGTITIALDVLENGRGPHVDATLRLAADGTIASLTATGHHEMGTKVDEKFVREGDHARWKSEEENDARDVSGSALYVPNCTMPDVLGLLVQAAKPAGGKLALLPGGEARVEQVAEVTVKAGSETRALIGYAIIGLDLTPTYTWMNPDGTWFGVATPWFSVVPEGWEAAIEPLVAKRRELIRARDAQLATEQAHRPPAAGLAYTHARVLDVERGRWLADQTVLVVGNTIKSVGPSKRAKLPAGVEVVDLAGRALMPGLVDMHAHLDTADGVLDLASGVTTARDVGNDPDELDDMKQRFDEGSAVGPHVIRFGFIEGRNEKAAASKVTAETAEEAEAAVDFFAKRGYEGIKIYNSVRPELVPVISKAAHARAMKVTGHIPVHMLAHEAVRDGYDGIEHVNMLFLNFFATHDTDTRDTTRFTLVGDNAAGFDLASKPVRDFIELLRQHKTLIDPTLAAFEDLYVGVPGKITPGLEDLVARLPLQTQRNYLAGGLPVDSQAKRELYLASWAKLLAMVKTLFDAKVSLAIGTDALAGLMLHHEMALFVRAGIPAADVLRIATLGAARSLGLERTTGTIAAGKIADLVVVDGDPLARIDDIGHVVSTMRGGVVFQSAALYRAVGVRP